MNQRRLTVIAIGLLGLIVLVGGWKTYGARQLHRLEARENDPNPVKAQKVGGLHRSLTRPVPFTRVVVDNITRLNGRKPKVIIDPDGRGGVVGAQAGATGFALYRPGKAPALISTYSGGIGSEDAQAADLDGDGSPDIVVGGLDGVTFILYNPRHQGCANVYACRWKMQIVDKDHSSHDVLVGDVDHDGAVDIVTGSGVYFNRDRGRRWVFAGRALIARDGEGTSLADIAGDGIPDIVAPYHSGTILARFVNPLHNGGDPTRDVWAVQAIDTHPLLAGNMSIATTDVSGDGRNDIVLAPMYGGGGLVWYEGPRRVTDSWERHMIDSSINFVHQGSLQIGDFNGDGQRDIAFAEQDQSPTRRVGVLYNVNGDGTRWKLQILALNGGHNIKAGILGHDHRPSILTARHGFFGGANPLVVWRDASP
jgi:hypothetical protein